MFIYFIIISSFFDIFIIDSFVDFIALILDILIQNNIFIYYLFNNFLFYFLFIIFYYNIFILFEIGFIASFDTFGKIAYIITIIIQINIYVIIYNIIFTIVIYMIISFVFIFIKLYSLITIILPDFSIIIILINFNN